MKRMEPFENLFQTYWLFSLRSRITLNFEHYTYSRDTEMTQRYIYNNNNNDNDNNTNSNAN